MELRNRTFSLDNYLFEVNKSMQVGDRLILELGELKSDSKHQQ